MSRRRKKMSGEEDDGVEGRVEEKSVRVERMG